MLPRRCEQWSLLQEGEFIAPGLMRTGEKSLPLEKGQDSILSSTLYLQERQETCESPGSWTYLRLRLNQNSIEGPHTPLQSPNQQCEINIKVEYNWESCNSRFSWWNSTKEGPKTNREKTFRDEDTGVWLQVCLHAQVGELWWESTQETKGKTQRLHVR